ncbi:MAG: DUF4249 domain-containing protein [Tannerellaceae bacterium]|nr:DUF4249 domain-containing protein [Tannerellaceae bacterium]
MNKNIKINSLVFVIAALIYACTDRIDISTDDAPPRLVIYGYITTDKTAHSIKITRSGSYFATTPPEGISGAIVKIRNSKEEYLLPEDPDTPGLYVTDADVAGVEGETYTLYVAVDFDGQMEEYTASSYLPYPVEIDKIDLKESDYFDDRIDVLFYGRLPDESDDNYLSFHTYRNNIALTDSLINFSVVDGEYIEKKELEAVRCTRLKQDEERSTLVKGDVVTLRVDAITKEYHDFVMNAQSELYGSNPIFSGPPANIQTNITAVRSGNDIPISGFFTAYSSKQASTVW